MTAREALIPIGEWAPDFVAAASDGADITLSRFRNVSPVVLIFYPGDYTPRCTAQLCDVRDRWPHFREAEAQVFGVNPFPARIHAGFATNARLPFPLLHDRGGAICAAYGCRALLGFVKRSVYIVDRHGRVAFAERGAPDAERILAVVRTL